MSKGKRDGYQRVKNIITGARSVLVVAYDGRELRVYGENFKGPRANDLGVRDRNFGAALQLLGRDTATLVQRMNIAMREAESGLNAGSEVDAKVAAEKARLAGSVEATTGFYQVERVGSESSPVGVLSEDGQV